MKKMKKTDQEIKDLISIGFCQPKFYKTSVWARAKRVMEELCKTEYVTPFDYGRGKGKYTYSEELRELGFTKAVDFLVEQYKTITP